LENRTTTVGGGVRLLFSLRIVIGPRAAFETPSPSIETGTTTHDLHRIRHGRGVRPQRPLRQPTTPTTQRSVPALPASAARLPVSAGTTAGRSSLHDRPRGARRGSPVGGADSPQPGRSRDSRIGPTTCCTGFGPS